MTQPFLKMGGGAIEKSAHLRYFESRYPVALTILTVVLLLTTLPGRIRQFPLWAPCILGAMVLAPLAGVVLSANRARWLRLERTITLLFVTVVGLATLVNLANLVRAMLRPPEEISGLVLLASSIGVWVTNVLVFSLLYWQIDRGGPGTWDTTGDTRPDWLFTQDGMHEDAPPGWRPNFVDYLFLGFSTATAFSATDTLPLSSRAKMLMMLESLISLLTIALVASRAINILG